LVIVWELSFEIEWFGCLTNPEGNTENASCTKTAVAASLCDAQPQAVIHPRVASPTGRRLQLRAKRAQAARARKCMRQETATEPSMGSTPEFWKIEAPGPVR